MDGLLALPMVGDLVKSLKEVSNVLVSSPTVRVEGNGSRMSGSGNGSEQARGNATTGDRTGSNGAEKKTPGVREKVDGGMAGGRREDGADKSDKGGQKGKDGMKDKPFNFASADAGARILATSAGVVGAKNVIIGSVDKYSLAPCDGEGMGGARWIDVELSEDVILESVETGNLEYYSSSARRVGILGASRYPPETWTVLGVFEFADVRTLQRFEIEGKGMTTRYLRLLFAGKQGNEYYCPISTIRAFGKSLIADWKDAFEIPMDSVSSGGERNEGRSDEGIGAGAADPPAAPSADATPDEWNTNNDMAQQNLDTRRGESAAPPGGGTERPDDTKHPAQADARRGDGEESKAEKREACEGDGCTQEGGGSAGDGMSEEERLLLEAVRADALSSVSGNDNIFRKVTRLIRVLELNQTLTNQYIETHLSRMARMLERIQAEMELLEERGRSGERRVIGMVVGMEGRIRELEREMGRRDMVVGGLVGVVGVLVGGIWVLWTAVGGGRMGGGAGGARGVEDGAGMAGMAGMAGVGGMAGVAGMAEFGAGGGKGARRRKRRNGRMSEGGFGGRSVSSMELVGARHGRGDGADGKGGDEGIGGLAVVGLGKEGRRLGAID